MADRVLRATLVVNHRIFLYGTLCDPELFAIVAGEPFNPRPALLDDHASVWARDESFPLIVRRPGARTEGAIVEVGDAAKARLDFYELGFHYTLEPVTVNAGGVALESLVYFPDAGKWAEGQPWSLPEWQHVFGTHAREAATEYMSLIATHSPEAAAAAFPQIRMRAASRLRAGANPTPHAAGPEMRVEDVNLSVSRQPYTKFFALREDDLQFPTFGGGLSEMVNRATFLGGDAVTILPYDPKLDCVLLIRQFRHGVYVRGDSNPWTIEPAAGRIDPGETPEETALRELREETGAVATKLFRVAEYYPSPSAFSEFIYSFVALADLSEQDGRTAGLESENEDIMSHVIPFERLMEFLETGAANTAPLVLSALWLASRRETLRRAD
ncbi:NUDIX domain-containing protein [Silicimonas sp. MF1-12-2]|uniref:NUDIX domain-containing protein n=1 Tax=Silicimonas sp. MF1-12-2 TaxID=3384793 RepID=UPI0039B4CB1D